MKLNTMNILEIADAYPKCAFELDAFLNEISISMRYGVEFDKAECSGEFEMRAIFLHLPIEKGPLRLFPSRDTTYNEFINEIALVATEGEL